MMHRPAHAVPFLLALWASAAAAWGVTVDQVPNPRPFSWVSDRAGRVTIEATDAIDALAGELKAEGRGELAVAVVLGIDGADPRAFATELFNRWGVGDATRDDGVLIFVALDDRAAEIVLGEGVDTSQNVRRVERVMREVMVPRLRNGDVSGAVLEGAKACAARVLVAQPAAPPPSPARPPAPAPPRRGDGLPAVEAEDDLTPPLPEAAPHVILPQPVAPQPRPRPQPGPPVVTRGGSAVSSWAWGLPLLVAPLLGAGVIVAVVTLVVRHATRPPACPLCGRPMELLGEQADDAHLTDGERLEERLGSVDHKVWYCDQDNRVERTASNAWFTRYAACAACHHRTLGNSSTVLQPATYSGPGLMRVDSTCAHCGHTESGTRIIPQKRRPSEHRAGMSRGVGIGSGFAMRSSGSLGSSRSSFGSRSRGFGGGRSSGRGASGRW